MNVIDADTLERVREVRDKLLLKAAQEAAELICTRGGTVADFDWHLGRVEKVLDETTERVLRRAAGLLH